MSQSGDGVVVPRWRRHFAESARPFLAVGFRDAPKFAVCQSRPAFEQRDKDLIPIVPRARFDRHVISLVLLMDFERLAESHFR